jgi:hypothetical protein
VRSFYSVWRAGDNTGFDIKNTCTSTRYQALRGLITLTEQIVIAFDGILDYVTGQRQLQHRESRRREQQSRRSQSFTVLLEKLPVPRLVKKPTVFKVNVFKKQPATLPCPEPINPVFEPLTDWRIN